MPGPLLEVRGLSVDVRESTRRFNLVDEVSISVPQGRIVALVGESGCGKSVTALSILRLLPPTTFETRGEILLFDPERGDGDRPGARDLLRSPERDLRRIRGRRIAMVFQDPMSSLNPVQAVGAQVAECVELHTPLRGRDAWDRAVALLNRVGIRDADRRARDVPHRLSGGMRQRVIIAMAVACEPALLIADEPTTALDVTVQLQILQLLRGELSQAGRGLLVVTHDFGVVSELADDVYVMYAGRIVEHGPAEAILQHPRHPYTQALLRCTPRLADRVDRLPVIAGVVPDRGVFPSGCRFHPRCSLTRERAGEAGRASVTTDDAKLLRRCVECYGGEASGAPVLREVSAGHRVACWEVA